MVEDKLCKYRVTRVNTESYRQCSFSGTAQLSY